MTRHADFLGLLYLAWGAIFALVGLACFALFFGALVIARETGPVTGGPNLAAGLTAVTLVTLAALSRPGYVPILVSPLQLSGTVEEFLCYVPLPTRQFLYGVMRCVGGLQLSN